MKLTLKMYGTPVLRQKAIEITKFDSKLKELSEEMFRVMYEAKGIGLAAEQIGRKERIFVIDIPPLSDTNQNGERENPNVQMPEIFINPKIISHSESTQKGIEGCLSFPGITAEIERFYEVRTEYMDLNGITKIINAKGLLARAIQHELDHLNGVLFIDKISPIKKILLDGKLKKLLKETKKNL